MDDEKVQLVLGRTDVEFAYDIFKNYPGRIWIIPSGYEDMFLFVSEDEAYNISVVFKSKKEIEEWKKENIL